jgi:hypothetical protein
MTRMVKNRRLAITSLMGDFENCNRPVFPHSERRGSRSAELKFRLQDPRSRYNTELKFRARSAKVCPAWADAHRRTLAQLAIILSKTREISSLAL